MQAYLNLESELFKSLKFTGKKSVIYFPWQWWLGGKLAGLNCSDIYIRYEDSLTGVADWFKSESCLGEEGDPSAIYKSFLSCEFTIP